MRASRVAPLVKNPPAMQDPGMMQVWDDLWRSDKPPTPVVLGFPGGSDGKESACSTKTWVLSLGWEDPLEKDMATHSSILACRIPMDRGAWQATVYGVTKSQTWLSTAQHVRGWAIRGFSNVLFALENPQVTPWAFRLDFIYLKNKYTLNFKVARLFFCLSG